MEEKKLNLGERIALLGILPKEGNYITLKIVKELQMALSPSEEEFKEFGIKQNGETVTWNNKGIIEKGIPIGEKATDIIKDALDKLDKDKKLTVQHMSLYEKFMKGE